MKLVSKFRFFLGVVIIMFLIASYFVTVEADIGANYAVTDTVLGLLIFHNFFVLLLYALIAGLLIFTGLKRVKIA